jgi:hypothetical protein
MEGEARALCGGLAGVRPSILMFSPAWPEVTPHECSLCRANSGVRRLMSSGPIEPGELLDLKLLPSWLKESAPVPSYEHYKGEEERSGGPRGREDGRGPGRRPDRRMAGREREARPSRERKPPRRDGKMDGARNRPHDQRPPHGDDDRRRRETQEKAAQDLVARVSVRFLPRPPVLENVVTQIKSNPVAYSVFGLARLFLDKPERYDVSLTIKPEAPLHQLGENGPISADREFLESNAFRLAQAEFYKVEVVQSEPIKGNFTTVARCRASGTLLGPTNHHAYQPKLRSLYEQRFSRRMSFPDYQRQIEIVSDPAVVEQWKEEARNVTTFTTLKEEPPISFSNAAEAERHFRQHYLTNLVHPVTEQAVDGVASRQLADRGLRRLVEDAWSRETRSPSQIMQELSSRFRETGLHIFRHRRGMLFVTSVRVRPFAHEETSVSAHVQAILQTLAANPGTNRKDLADKILTDVPAESADARKMELASDLRWLISEGNVIEFNDGSLDLPRAKVKAVETGVAAQNEVKVETGPALTETRANDAANATEEEAPGPVIEVAAQDTVEAAPGGASAEPG